MPGRDQIFKPAARDKFRRDLLGWYDKHQRDLPWRANKDPYRVWVSEIMLQQTRVAAVINHYNSFIEQFPNVTALAAATESQVLGAWSGLGYYRRARAMHEAARSLVKERGGEIPQSSTGLRDLPGIGKYTANAIASIAFDEPVPVVDGNVERVLERVAGKEFAVAAGWELAADVLDCTRPGDFNQAMMELGAVVCTPQIPKCDGCPVRSHCATRGTGQRRRAPKVVRRRSATYQVGVRRGRVYLVTRPRESKLMPGMWELPGGGTGSVILKLTHTITNNLISVVVREANGEMYGGKWVPLSQVGRLPLTGVTRKILRHLGHATLI